MQQIQPLKIGDEIGFVRLARHIDDSDRVEFYPIALITERDGETAYRYLFPDGIISGAAIRHSHLLPHLIKRAAPVVAPVREATAAGETINLAERQIEFREALARGAENGLEVFEDWDRDSFVVVNRENKTEHRLRFEEIGGAAHASCDCNDFKYRRRICKHLACVMVERWFAVKI